MLAGYANCSRSLIQTPKACFDSAHCEDEGAVDVSMTVPQQVSNELLLRGWIGGLFCGGDVPKSTSECPCPHTTRDISEDSTNFYDFYDVDNPCDIGKGGFGIVSRAFHRASRTRCAVKIIDKEGAGKAYRDHLPDGGVYDCLLRMTVETPSPNVVHYLDLLEGVHNYFVVMEDLEGVELLAQLEKDLPVSESYCQHVMKQILRSLVHLHNVVGLIHRDVKLENFRYRRRSTESELVLVDFGLARFVAEEWDGSVSGTLLYLAPEAIRAISPHAVEGYAAPADVWSAGLIFYMMLLGRVPWDDTKIWTLGKTEAEARALLSAVLDDAVLKDYSREAVDFLRSLMEYDPKVRASAAKALEHPWLSMPSTLLEKTLRCVNYGIVREASRASKVWTSYAVDATNTTKCVNGAKATCEGTTTSIPKTSVPVRVPLCVAPPSGVSEDFMY